MATDRLVACRKGDQGIFLGDPGACVIGEGKTTQCEPALRRSRPQNFFCAVANSPSPCAPGAHTPEFGAGNELFGRVPREARSGAPEMRFRRCEISAQQVPLGDIEMGFASRLRLRTDQIEGV